MLSLLSLLLLAPVSPTAQAHELSFELGSFGAPDEDWALFSSNGQVGTWGFRGGVSLSKAFSIVGGWQHGVNGQSVYYEGLEEYDEDFEDSYYDDGYAFHTKFVTDRFSLGPKLSWKVMPWLAPYGTVQGVAWVGRIRLDDDIEEEGNPNERAFSAVAPGGLAALGVDIMPFAIRRGTRVATHLEAGYGITTAMGFEDQGAKDAANQGAAVPVGDIGFRGFYLSWGVGLVF